MKPSAQGYCFEKADPSYIEERSFNQWLKEKGKLGGQHKVPRLSNDREIY
jgi:hypothetical protein